jgi:ribosomal protein S18 acetylase RimI-like enzyme
MLYAAAFWRRSAMNPVKRTLLRKYLAQYHVNWGRPGDVGFVAEVNGTRVGAVWYRLFTNESHGDGFVDEQTPELVIAVRSGHRGQGIGRSLLDRIHEQARLDGIDQIGLSVNADNPARRLYEAAGYRDYHRQDGKERMVLALEPKGSTS